MRLSLLSSLIVSCLPNAFAQFPPEPEGVTVLKSKFHEGIKISYKEPGICETTPGVKSYAGYVHLPPYALNETYENQDYPINTFFWFFEARKAPHHAPLAIWLNGGPGGSSLIGALQENGPCFVGNDSNSTYLNPWSWNNEVNILYLDQPNQVGFSYDTLTNITTSLAEGPFFGINVEPANFTDGVPEQNLTFLVGTTGSQEVRHTANSTTHSAVALWHFAQTWFEEFPHYKPADEQISLFTESYGGHYGPAFVSFFMRQNELISNGTIAGPGVHYLHLNTLGIVNGCIDVEEETLAYASFARHNTYGIQAVNESQYYQMMYEITRRDGGVLDRIHECQRLQSNLDPDDHGDVERVANYCRFAADYAQNVTVLPYVSNRKNGWFDITHPAEDPFPPPYSSGFLNKHWVQRALGVPSNHSFVSPAVSQGFEDTGDFARAGLVEDIAYILDHGVKVAMMYGDRDFACNWVGGEKTSLKVPWYYQDQFRDAGYTPLALSSLRSGGLTRQYGNLSFTRVYQAGHMVPSYQPEAAYRIFMRAITGRDIATGSIDLRDFANSGEQYSTHGPDDTWWMKSDILPSPPRECYVLDIQRCNDEEKEAIRDGTAIVKDWIVVGREKLSSWPYQPESDFQLPIS